MSVICRILRLLLLRGLDDGQRHDRGSEGVRRRGLKHRTPETHAERETTNDGYAVDKHSPLSPLGCIAKFWKFGLPLSKASSLETPEWIVLHTCRLRRSSCAPGEMSPTPPAQQDLVPLLPLAFCMHFSIHHFCKEMLDSSKRSPSQSTGSPALRREKLFAESTQSLARLC